MINIPVAFFVLCHEAPHTLLFNALLLFLLLTLRIGVVIEDGLVYPLDLQNVVAVELLQVLSVRQHCAQIFLKSICTSIKIEQTIFGNKIQNILVRRRMNKKEDKSYTWCFCLLLRSASNFCCFSSFSVALASRRLCLLVRL